uniref:Putative secreted protein n=1 Tax=Anopheles darlingi TaxID=43151 RepID=A0A2M4DLL0_ANODA
MFFPLACFSSSSQSFLLSSGASCEAIKDIVSSAAHRISHFSSRTTPLPRSLLSFVVVPATNAVVTEFCDAGSS